MEFTLLFAAIAGVTGVQVGLRLQARRDATLCLREIWDIAIAAGVVGLVVGRLVAMIRAGTNPLEHPGDVLIVRSGVDTVAASLAGIATATWMGRRRIGELLDPLGPAALLGLAGWHLGCLFRDACLGSPSSFPWAWAQPGSDVSRHPVEIYAGLLFVLAAAGVEQCRLRGLRQGRGPAPGSVAAFSLAVAAAVRLATEPVRPTLGAGLEWWYAAAVVIGLALVGGAFLRPVHSGA